MFSVVNLVGVLVDLQGEADKSQFDEWIHICVEYLQQAIAYKGVNTLAAPKPIRRFAYRKPWLPLPSAISLCAAG
ncbi:hypothetical protein D3C84_673560 [compost metagenome]